MFAFINTLGPFRNLRLCGIGVVFPDLWPQTALPLFFLFLKAGYLFLSLFMSKKSAMFCQYNLL